MDCNSNLCSWAVKYLINSNFNPTTRNLREIFDIAFFSLSVSDKPKKTAPQVKPKAKVPLPDPKPKQKVPPPTSPKVPPPTSQKPKSKPAVPLPGEEDVSGERSKLKSRLQGMQVEVKKDEKEKLPVQFTSELQDIEAVEGGSVEISVAAKGIYQ